MQTSLPGQVTTVDQDSPARQIGCGGKGESLRTLSAAFPPRSGFVQPHAQPDPPGTFLFLRHVGGGGPVSLAVRRRNFRPCRVGEKRIDIQSVFTS